MAAMPTSSRAATVAVPVEFVDAPSERVRIWTGSSVSCGRLEFEQCRLGLRAAEVAAHAAVGLDDSVAGHDDGQRVRGACRADGAERLGTARELGDGRVAGGVAVLDVGEVLQHGGAEAGRQSPVERHAERSSASGEVLVELAGRGVETGGWCRMRGLIRSDNVCSTRSWSSLA